MTTVAHPVFDKQNASVSAHLAAGFTIPEVALEFLLIGDTQHVSFNHVAHTTMLLLAFIMQGTGYFLLPKHGLF